MNIRFTPTRCAYTGQFKTEKELSGVPTVYLRQVAEGYWVVHDKDFVRGGTFRDEGSALRFIRWEIDINSLVIVVREVKNSASGNSASDLSTVAASKNSAEE